MNVSEYIFDYFSKKGIDIAFCITGGHSMWLDDALCRNDKFNVTFFHHEESVTMSADSYGRIKNKPALSVITAGPAVFNAINGVVGGYTDSSPMIVISGQSQLHFVEYEDKSRIRQFGTQGVNIKPGIEPYVKYFKTLDNLDEIEYCLDEAYYLATSGRPGPVWIEVPLDIQSSKIDCENQKKFIVPSYNYSDVVESTAKIIFEKLATSKKPLFIAGQGISLSNSREDFKSFTHTLQIPIVTSRLGIDIIETDDSLYVGRPGNYGDRAANFAIQNADLIISIGSRLAGPMVGYNTQDWGKNAYKIVVDIDEKELEKPSINIDFKSCCDCKLLLNFLNNEISNYNIPNYDKWKNICLTWKNKYPVCLKEYGELDAINSYYLCNRISLLNDNHKLVLVDTGSCFHVACQTWNVKKNQKFLTTGGLSSMGYWVACIGACIANNCDKTICITGDGSFQMNIQELATIVGNKLPIKIFIIDNDGYLLIRHTQRNFMNDRFFGEGNKTGVYIPDITKISEAYGLYTVRINSTDELDNKITEVLNYNGPVVCVVKCDNWQMLIPRVTSEKSSTGELISHDYSDMFPFLDRIEYYSNMNF